MKKNLVVFVLLVVSLTAIGQIKTEKKEVLKKIELQNFSNKLAFEMGLAVVELAKSRNQTIGVEISRLNQTIFLYIGDGLPADKHNWLRRKANVVKQLEQSSLSVKNDLKEGSMTLETTFGLDAKDFVARGGSIPIFVKDAGMIAIITVSGLRDEEDHQIIIDALKGKYF